jgi:DNA invertase Pin-like site-specific DNA recombinase
MTTERLAAIYTRVSTEEQAKTSGIPSTDTQVEECKKKAALLGIPVAPDGSDLIKEETHSGTYLRWEGTEFMDLVRRAQRHEFTDLIVLSVDRFSRGDLPSFFEQFGYFKEACVGGVHFADGNIPEPEPMQDIVLGNMAWAAQQARNASREASIRVRTALAARGDLIAGSIAPFGWQFVEDKDRPNRRDKPTKIGLLPHPINAPVLVHMYEHTANGGSVGALKDWLEENHVSTPKGAPVWHRAAIRRILHNSTNWDERQSFLYHAEPHPNAARRSIHEKSRFQRTRVPMEEQYKASKAVLAPIPGLTKDLAMRALDRLKDNKNMAALRSPIPEAQRAEQALLFGGMVR